MGPCIVRTLDGQRLRVDLGDISGQMLVCSGIWEPNVTAAFRTLLSLMAPSSSMQEPTSATSRCWPRTSSVRRAKVYALEPSPTTFAALSGSNLRLNRAENVVALEVAAGSEAGIGALRIAPTENSRTGVDRPSN